MFVTHDLSVVRHISDDICVMYLGQLVETCPTDELFENSLHPYTKALLNAIPKPNLSFRTKTRQILRGEVTSPINPKPGCRFASRCPHATKRCSGVDPVLTEASAGHRVACTLFSE